MTAAEDEFHREVIAESDWDYEPACPKCGATITHLFEICDGEGPVDWDSDDCGTTLEVRAEYSVEYQLTHFKPSTFDKRRRRAAAKRARELEAERRRRQPEVEARREAKTKRRESAPKSWTEFTWERWIPEKLRTQIQEFWSERLGRGPFGYAEDILQQGAPPNGTRFVLARNTCNEVEGRYVHAWNNMGRIVRDNGDHIVVSIHPRNGDYNLSLGRHSAGDSPLVADSTRVDPTE